MMQGYVNENYEAVLTVVVKNGNKFKSINAVIDTGFTGFLSLPIAIITELDLSWNYRDRGTLGDGSETLFDIYDAMVIWNPHSAAQSRKKDSSFVLLFSPQVYC